VSLTFSPSCVLLCGVCGILRSKMAAATKVDSVPLSEAPPAHISVSALEPGDVLDVIMGRLTLADIARLRAVQRSLRAYIPLIRAGCCPNMNSAQQYGRYNQWSPAYFLSRSADSDITAILFRAHSQRGTTTFNDIHVALSSVCATNEPMYEVRIERSVLPFFHIPIRSSLAAGAILYRLCAGRLKVPPSAQRPPTSYRVNSG
jgi:hypothetical protein